jgi:hypothetical protein
MEDLLKLIITGLFTSATLIFIGKFILNRGADLLTENFKNNLEIKKIEHQIKFSELNQQRAEVIKQIFNSLYDFEQSLRFLTSVFQGPEWSEDNDRILKSRESYKKAIDLLEYNRIYLEESTCKRIEETLQEGGKIITEMHITKLKARHKENKHNAGLNYQFPKGEDPLEIWLNLENKVHNQIKSLRLDIADEFRKILGVGINNTN